MREPRPPCELDLPDKCLHTSLLNPQVSDIASILMLALLCCVAFAVLLFCLQLLRPRCTTRSKAASDAPEAAPACEAALEPYREASVLTQFLEQRDGIVLQGVDGPVSYEALRFAASRCKALLAPHVLPGGLVALYLQSGPRLVAAVLGTWMAKCAWAPLDRKGPQQRVRELLLQVAPQALLCDDVSPFQNLLVPVLDVQSISFSEKPQEVDTKDINDNAEEVDLEALAQVIYTSGSTGKPKGVMFSHRRLAHSTHFFAKQCGIDEKTRILQKTPYVWSVFRHEVYPALCHRGTICHVEPSRASDPMHLVEVVEAQQVSVLVATPSVLELVLDCGGLSSLQRVVCMGEPLSWRLASKVQQKLPAVQLMNFYGSTETENTTFTVPRLREWPGQSVPAGRPQPHVEVHLLQVGGLEECPEGEVCFSGVMSSGYWQQPELTAASFVQHPQLGLVYRTGDLGKWQKGQLVVLGRIDRQVKIRGCRVELHEIELALAPFVKEVAVVAAPGPHGHLQTVAFVVAQDVQQLEKDMQERLLSHQMPSVFESLEALPRLATGKPCLAKLRERAEHALLQKDSETTASLDSLGVLQHLTKTQLQEDRWLQNQQAFWTVVVMMQHFGLTEGAAQSGPKYAFGDSGDMAIQVIAFLCHARDMVAFILLLGFTDSRGELRLGQRDVAVLVTALLMTFLANPLRTFASHHGRIDHWGPYVGADWFLYVYLWCRLLLIQGHRLGIAQAVLFLLLDCLVPDDLWLQIPLDYRQVMEKNFVVLQMKGPKFGLFFMPGCYLLAWHATRLGLANWARRTSSSFMSKGQAVLERIMKPEVAEAALKASVVAGGFVFYLAISLLSAVKRAHSSNLNLAGISNYQQGYQAVYVEGGWNYERFSHVVTWHYMTHPSFLHYLALWIGEALLLILPTLAVAIAFAYVPWHFKTMGTTCFGTYVIHVLVSGLFLFGELTNFVLLRITRESWPPIVNCLIVVCWNILFCIVFAHTVGQAFHRVLISGLCGLARLASKPREPEPNCLV